MSQKKFYLRNDLPVTGLVKFYKYLQNIMAGSEVTVPQLLEVLKRKDDKRSCVNVFTTVAQVCETKGKNK